MIHRTHESGDLLDLPCPISVCWVTNNSHKFNARALFLVLEWDFSHLHGVNELQSFNILQIDSGPTLSFHPKKSSVSWVSSQKSRFLSQDFPGTSQSLPTAPDIAPLVGLGPELQGQCCRAVAAMAPTLRLRTPEVARPGRNGGFSAAML